MQERMWNFPKPIEVQATATAKLAPSLTAKTDGKTNWKTTARTPARLQQKTAAKSTYSKDCKKERKKALKDDKNRISPGYGLIVSSYIPLGIRRACM